MVLWYWSLCSLNCPNTIRICKFQHQFFIIQIRGVSTVCPAVGHKGHMPLMNQTRGVICPLKIFPWWIKTGGLYAPLKYSPDEIQNRMFLILIKKALKGAILPLMKMFLHPSPPKNWNLPRMKKILEKPLIKCN